MNVLFVSSGNILSDISPIIRNQGDSIKKNGVEIEYFKITEKGTSGYLKNIFRLKRFLKNNRFDIVHAHYSLSAFVASLAGSHPLVVSLMGSDVQPGIISRGIIKLFNRCFWDALILKSECMKQKVDIQKSMVIPNGVNFDMFKKIDKKIARKKVGFKSRKHVIFVSNPERKEKNFRLAEKAVKLLDDPDVELNVVSGVPYDLIPYYYFAADVLLLTSLWEGSPNVIKEAMVCNCPIVATDVGDIKWVISGTAGCFLVSFSLEDVANKIKMALDFKKRTKGRNRIIKLGLESNSVAKRIISIYETVIETFKIKK